MAKFNLQKFQSKDQKNAKDQSDEHTNFRLKKDHVEAPEVLTEKQLEKDRVDEPEVLTEKLLESKRTGGAEVILEKNLNDSKSMFGSKFRNPEAYQGDINKIEEKRLSGNKTEDEKYSASSETPKKMRWWETLKKASDNATIKTAALDDDEPYQDTELDLNEADPSRFKRWQELEGDEPEGGLVHDVESGPMGGANLSDVAEDIGTEDALKEDTRSLSNSVRITDNKSAIDPFPYIYMKFDFDFDSFNGNTEAVKEAALEKAIAVRPQLAGKITTMNFSEPKGETISLKLVGDEYFQQDEEENTELFMGSESDEVDMGGTPMVVGKVTIDSMAAETMDKDALMQATIDYIAEKEGYEVPESSLSINFEKGEITFAYPQDSNESIGSESMEETEEPENEEVETAMPEVMEPQGAEMPEENIPLPTATSKSIYDFPIIIADAKEDSKKK